MKISAVCGACRCLFGCLAQTDGEGGRESLIETEPVRSVIHSPVRSSFPRVHSSRLSTRRQEAKPLLSFPGWVNFPSLSFGKEASVSTGHLFFIILIISRFHTSLLFCSGSKEEKRTLVKGG